MECVRPGKKTAARLVSLLPISMTLSGRCCCGWLNNGTSAVAVALRSASKMKHAAIMDNAIDRESSNTDVGWVNYVCLELLIHAQ